MTRGDLVTVVASGDFGKPRPALVVQSDRFVDMASVTVLLMTGTLIDAPLLRIAVEPTSANGLEQRSQVMVDKAMTIRREKIRGPFGRLDEGTMSQVDQRLAFFLGFA